VTSFSGNKKDFTMVALGRYLKQTFGTQATPPVVSQVKKPSAVMNPPQSSPVVKDVEREFNKILRQSKYCKTEDLYKQF
jgi:hypothetical protein